MSTWVLLRGLTREHAHWGAFVAQLAQATPQMPIVTPDLPGAGALREMRCPWRVEAMVEPCRAQLRGQGVVPPYRLLGLSLGGMVAAAWAEARPDEVDGCALINTSMRPFSTVAQRLRPARWPGLLRLLGSHDAQHIERTILRLTSSTPQAHAALLDEWVAIRRARPVSTASALRQLLAAACYRHPGPVPQCPTLVVCSAGDALVDAACSRTLARQWIAPLRVHASAGHDLPLDAGVWLAGQLAAWCRQDAVLTHASRKMPE